MADYLSATGPAGITARGSETHSCWLCGTWLHKYQLIPDGGLACSDLRWYCRDVQRCTERWTAGLQGQPAEVEGAAQAAVDAALGRPPVAAGGASPPSD